MRIFVRPAPGLRVLGPDGVPLPDAGAEVDGLSSFWLRRIAKGDVVRVDGAIT